MRTREIPSEISQDILSKRVQVPPEKGPLPYIPDKSLTHYQEGIRWTFSEGKVSIDGQDVNRMLNAHPTDLSLWMGVGEGLSEYRKRVGSSKRQIDQFAQFQAVVEALLSKILGRMKKIYDQKMSGLSWTLDHGHFILNGINVRSFLALYRLRKTEKAKKFLKGLKEKIQLVLENRSESPDNERIHELVENLYREVELELAETSARPSGRLLPPPSHAP